ncbi:hypothetical protein SSTG_05732 [Streptomyces sp. e14]|nr:hypothetical protein SSTG_05732 [Streptomyces sp. e14]
MFGGGRPVATVGGSAGEGPRRTALVISISCWAGRVGGETAVFSRGRDACAGTALFRAGSGRNGSVPGSAIRFSEKGL